MMETIAKVSRRMRSVVVPPERLATARAAGLSIARISRESGVPAFRIYWASTNAEEAAQIEATIERLLPREPITA
jgi:hypothetical protein